MPTKKPSRSSKNKSISIKGDVRDSTVIVGDNNLFQKIINYIFPSEKETLEQRNRRILLGHVENAWIKGVLDASLHGAALLDLGIKQDPEAVTQYPWAIKKESTDETLPAGTSMLEIFDSIGMGRSLLILGSPGSGKTTMLLELARGLIARARENVTQPIPMVFNLASWTEKLTLADWLAQELNNLYSVPRKTAPDWVKGNKLLFLLDGLDEVRQESLGKCINAINQFRKEYGTTSLVVCSRSQDYGDIKTKLSFEGAIEIQPLTSKQIAKFFDRFGKDLAGIAQILNKSNALREIAQTPLILSIMAITYRNQSASTILISDNTDVQRKYIIEAYITTMFERARGSRNVRFKKRDILYWLSWLSNNLIKHNQTPFLIEKMQPEWLDNKRKIFRYKITLMLFIGLFFGLLFGWVSESTIGSNIGIIVGIIMGLIAGFSVGENTIKTVDALDWSIEKGRLAMFGGLVGGFVGGPIGGVKGGLLVGLGGGLIGGLLGGLSPRPVENTTIPNQRVYMSLKNSIFVFLIVGLLAGIVIGITFEATYGLVVGLILGFMGSLSNGGSAVIQHYYLRWIFYRTNNIPLRLTSFLDYAVDLIFLRRVGGGYIFVSHSLMEHFAEMYTDLTG